MESGGIGTLRAFFAWSSLDPTAAPDDYDWTVPDAMVAGAAARGIEVFPYLFASPEWAAKLDYPDCDPATECPIAAPVGDEALAAWRQFVGAAVDRYGPAASSGARTPTCPRPRSAPGRSGTSRTRRASTGPLPTSTPTRRCCAAPPRRSARATPTPRSSSAGCSGRRSTARPPALTATDFLRRLYAVPGIADSFDGISAHPYAGKVGSVEEQVTRASATRSIAPATTHRSG